MGTEADFEDGCEFEAEAEVVVFVDENNKEYEFEILDELCLDEVKYLALLPTEDDNDVEFHADELVVAKTLQENGEESLVLVDDDDEFERISKLFTERLTEFFDIVEDENGCEGRCESGCDCC
jgi:uncharacterized protein YrzB (UPF0473 family)